MTVASIEEKANELIVLHGKDRAIIIVENILKDVRANLKHPIHLDILQFWDFVKTKIELHNGSNTERATTDF